MPAGRLAVGAVIALLLALALFAGLSFSARGESLPGVRVGGVSVGGLSEGDLRAKLGDRAAALAAQPVRLALGDRAWDPLPADLGVTYDASAAAGAAMDAGRDRPLGGFFRVAGLDREAISLPLPVAFDRVAFDAYLDRIDAEAGQVPIDAAVDLDGTRAQVRPAREGRGVDREAVRAALLPQIARLQPASVALVERPLPPAVPTDRADAVAAQVGDLLAAPLRLTAGEETWPVAPEELAPLVRVAPIERDGRTALAAGLDDAGLRTLVDGFADQIDAPTADAWVEEFDTFNRLHPASHGRTVRREELAAALHEAVAAGRRDVPLPIDQGAAPAVTTEALLADLGVTDLLAEGDSDFAGSPAERDNNVRLAAERIDGTLIPPGGEFSYNAALGTLFDSGFLFADANIEGLGTNAEGGGVCQVSTTVFRAALRAGMPIVEWWPHSYRSPFYEQGGWSAGFDAAIVQVYGDDEAGTDFRFQNPTDGWLLVGSRVEGNALRVELRGSDPGYTVAFNEPVQEWGEGAPGPEVEVDESLAPGEVVEDLAPTDALTVTIVRRVLDAEGNEVSVDSFVSPYRPRGAIRRVGPDEAEAA